MYIHLLLTIPVFFSITGSALAEEIKIPAEIQTRLRQELKLEPDCFRHPCVMESDFDGDKLKDLAILVRDTHCEDEARYKEILEECKSECTKEHGDCETECIFDPPCNQGIALFFASGKISLLGAGKTIECRGFDDEDGKHSWYTETLDADLGFVQHWKILSANGESGKKFFYIGKIKQKLKLPYIAGDGFYISGSDAAGIFYYSKGVWYFYHLGF